MSVDCLFVGVVPVVICPSIVGVLVVGTWDTQTIVVSRLRMPCSGFSFGRGVNWGAGTAQIEMFSLSE